MRLTVSPVSAGKICGHEGRSYDGGRAREAGVTISTVSHVVNGTRFVSGRPCDIFDHLIPCDRQIDAQRLRNPEHEPIANLPVAHRFAVFLPAHIHTCRQPLTRRRILVSQQC